MSNDALISEIMMRQFEYVNRPDGFEDFGKETRRLLDETVASFQNPQDGTPPMPKFYQQLFLHLQILEDEARRVTKGEKAWWQK